MDQQHFDGFFCQLCNINCMNNDGVFMHSESGPHRRALAKLEESYQEPAAVDNGMGRLTSKRENRKGRSQMDPHFGRFTSERENRMERSQIDPHFGRFTSERENRMERSQMDPHFGRFTSERENTMERSQMDPHFGRFTSGRENGMEHFQMDPHFDGFYCKLCKVNCMNNDGQSMHCQSGPHRRALAKLEESNHRPATEVPASMGEDTRESQQPEADEDNGVDGFFCRLCNIDCLNEDGVSMHCESGRHRMALANMKEDMESQKEESQDHGRDESQDHGREESQDHGREESQDHVENYDMADDSQETTFCEICQMECYTKQGQAMHCQSGPHRRALANLEESNNRLSTNVPASMAEDTRESQQAAADEDNGVDGFFCRICNIDCLNEDGVHMHCQSGRHRMALTNMKEDMESQREDHGVDSVMEDESQETTFCQICQMECYTKQGMNRHISSNGHMMAASQEIATEQEEKQQEETAKEEDQGPLYCRSCKLQCNDDEHFKTHTLTMGHCRKQKEYDHRRKRNDPLSEPLDIFESMRAARRQGKVSLASLGPAGLKEITQSNRAPEIFNCEMCMVSIFSEDRYDGHLQGGPHRKRQRAVDAGGGLLYYTAGLKTRPLDGPADIQPKVDAIDNYLVGLEDLYEIHRATTKGPPYYVCLLCDENYFEVLPHVTSLDHRMNYFKKHRDEHWDLMCNCAPKEGQKYYPWFERKYLRQLSEFPPEDGQRIQSPKGNMEKSMVKYMARDVEKSQGRSPINKVEEIRGKYEKPLNWKDEYPDEKPMNKWHAKRLLVGNVPYDVEEIELLDHLNRQTINRAIIDMELIRENAVAFIKFHSYEDTSQFLVFDGLVFKGIELIIRRPDEYVPLPGQDDYKVLLDCHIPAVALLKNQFVPSPAGSNFTNVLCIKKIWPEHSEATILEFINNQLLGTPAMSWVSKQPGQSAEPEKDAERAAELGYKQAPNQQNFFNQQTARYCSIKFRSGEETTEALETLTGELFHGININITRPKEYIAPSDQSSNRRHLDVSQTAQYKRGSADVGPLYHSPSKAIRMDTSDFIGGSYGFIKAGNVYNPNQQIEGPDYANYGQQQRPVQNYEQQQRPVQNYEQQQMPVQNYEQQQRPVQNLPSQGLQGGQIPVANQRGPQMGPPSMGGGNQRGPQVESPSVGGVNQISPQVEPPSVGSNNQYGAQTSAPAWQSQQPVTQNNQTESKHGALGEIANQYGVPQSQNYQNNDAWNSQAGAQGAYYDSAGAQYDSAGAQYDSAGAQYTNTAEQYESEYEQYYTQNNTGQSYGQESQDWSQNQPATTPDMYSYPEPPQPQLPTYPEPPQPQLPTPCLDMLKKAKEFLEGETICTDEEHVLARNVAKQLKQKINSYDVYKVRYSMYKNHDPQIKQPDEEDLEQHLDYIYQYLGKVGLPSTDELEVAKEILEIIQTEISKYKSRVEGVSAEQAATVPQPAVYTAPVIDPQYQNYYGYGNYGQYSTNTTL